MEVYSALILAGGAGRRLGGREKPALPVGGAPMLHRVLVAVAGAAERIVVGPDSLAVPAGVLRVQERPPGGGPVAAIAAGLPLVTTERVAVLAADLPFLSAGAVALLCGALDETPAADGAVFVDEDGWRQSLCGVWRTRSLHERVESLTGTETGSSGPARRPPRDGPAGRSLRELLAGLRVGEVVHRAAGPPPWYDCDTQDELDQAERWSRE